MSDSAIAGSPPEDESTGSTSGVAAAWESNRSLKSLALRGSALTMAGFGLSQVLRLAGSVILTRLLFPEAFGLMALVSVFMQGLAMFSDIGAGPAIVRHERGDDPVFLNTAWTMQVARGVAFWCAAGLLSQPFAAFYGQPELALLIPVSALTAIISGFKSTSLFTAKRHMALGRLIWIELFSQAGNIAAMIAFALVWPTVWALIVGGFAGNTISLVLSHVALPGPRNRFAWDRDSRLILFEFGKWIFLGTALLFLARTGDRLLLGHYLSMAILGIYTVALNLSEFASNLNIRLSKSVVYPVLSRIHREEPGRLAAVFYRTRLGLDGLLLPALGFLMAVAPLVIGLLYDERYALAGWILQVLSVRTAMRCMLEPCSSCVVAIGHPRLETFSHAARACWIAIAIPLGWQIGSLTGVVWASALSEVPVLVVLWTALWSRRLLWVSREALALLMLGGGFLAGWLCTALLN